MVHHTLYPAMEASDWSAAAWRLVEKGVHQRGSVERRSSEQCGNPDNVNVVFTHSMKH